MSAESDHAPPRVEAGFSGCRVLCPCGWRSHASLASSTATRRVALRWWYEHYIAKVRNEQPPGRVPDTSDPNPAAAERDGDPSRQL